VAELFAALEALAPGRSDLGIGRAPGSDPVITQLLRQSGTTSDVERFPDHVRDILSLVAPDGAALRFTSGGTYDVHATPAATTTPEVWLLGSSDYSAQLAAALGLPYVFANHFSGTGLERALELYRTAFVPSETLSAPRTFLTANVLVAPTQSEADERALPNLRMTARLRTNRPLIPLETVEQAIAGAADFDALGESFMTSARANWFVGEPGAVASDLRAFATTHGVDEVMISPIAGAYENEDLDASPGRVQTLELLAGELAL
jgi:luciferase family oxidoreductase group 1